jgi:DHHC palmitoyltransferase
MQGDRLESEEEGPVNASQEASCKFRSAYGDIELAPHTDEELSNIQFVPGLTMEQLQAQKTGVKVHQLSHSENETLAQSEESPLKHLERTSEKTKNKRRVKSMINNLGPVLRFCILTYQLTHAYFIVVYIAPTFDNPFSVWLVQLMSLAIYLTTTVNYHVTGHISSLSVKRTREEGFLPRQGYKCCDRCENIWKPDRTHHCSIQKHCVTRMDHYCPITLTTIGMRNHGSFFMTSIGHGLACAIWLALYPVYYVYNFRALARGNITKTVFVTALGFSDYLCVLSIFALSIGIIFAHLILIFNNATTLEGVPGEQHLFKEVRASRLKLQQKALTTSALSTTCVNSTLWPSDCFHYRLLSMLTNTKVRC